MEDRPLAFASPIRSPLASAARLDTDLRSPLRDPPVESPSRLAAYSSPLVRASSRGLSSPLASTRGLSSPLASTRALNSPLASPPASPALVAHRLYNSQPPLYVSPSLEILAAQSRWLEFLQASSAPLTEDASLLLRQLPPWPTWLFESLSSYRARAEANLTNGFSTYVHRFSMDSLFRSSPFYNSFDGNTSTVISLGILSQLAYASRDEIERFCALLGFEADFFRFVDLTRSTQFFVVRRGDTQVVVFRGAQKLDGVDWLQSNNEMAPLHDREYVGAPMVRANFLREVDSALYRITLHHRTWFTGHGVGGALATLAAVKLHARSLTDASLISGVVSFGSPKIGNEAFVRQFDVALSNRHFRVVNRYEYSVENPILPSSNPTVAQLEWAALYSHVGNLVYFGDSYQPNSQTPLSSSVMWRMLSESGSVSRSVEDHSPSAVLAKLVLWQDSLLRV
eukprot:TRINITY_DN4510_c0_g1_i1.p1 TRINITY_DN4510_c0_g1~~TRINITY_DN4510_c0_g1_i1.p1  ORF type:complete len:503 (+),score=109.61 TRINITY_DN4510_c0_g1_i1:149-1510(+)